MTEFEVAEDSVLYHFADFGVGNLPGRLFTVLQHGYVAVERAEKIVHVYEVGGQRQLVCKSVPLSHRSSFEERLI